MERDNSVSVNLKKDDDIYLLGSCYDFFVVLTLWSLDHYFLASPPHNLGPAASFQGWTL